MANPTSKTTLDADITKPSTTAPGDGPADTTDPTESAVSVTPRPSTEAVKVGTVNAVKPAPKAALVKTAQTEERVEKYDAVRPDGSVVTVTHNLDTGKTSVAEKVQPEPTPAN